uniref:plasmid recombination protein n=1 Tax=Faecalibacterium prausnitzii TaxID=853 RepID=UPI004038864C
MAHLEKYKASSVGHMLAHYRRDPSSLGRENIDPARVEMDYTLAIDPADGLVKPMEGVEPNWATVEGRIERVNERAKAEGKRAVRKDAVVMADVVVTLPENVRKGDEGKFFGWTYCFLADRLGSGNMLGGFVHRDEVRADGSPVRDHMHAPFTPILDGRFNFKKMCPRTFYQSLHKDLGDYLEQHLGYRPEIELEDGKRAQKALSRVDKRDIDAARAEILAPVERKAGEIVADATERAERASAARKRDENRLRAARSDLAKVERQRVESSVKLGAVNAKVDEKRAQAAEIDRQIAEKMAEIERLDGEIGEKIELRDEVGENLKREQRRLESVRRTAGRFEEDVEELEAIASLAERFDHAGRFEKRGMLDEIAARCDGLRGRVSQFVEEVREAVGRLGLAIADLTRRLGPRSARMTTKALKRDLAALERDYGEDDDRSFKARAAEAQRAARARDANRDDRPPQRSWSQSR